MNDQNERETVTIVLPDSKKEVKYFTYLKAKEVLGIQKATDGNKYLYETLVVSIDDSTENVYEKIIDLRYSDYMVLDGLFVKMLKEEVPEKDEEKKTSSTNITTSSEVKAPAQETA